MQPTTYQGVKISVDYEGVYDDRHNLYRINFIDHGLTVNRIGLSEQDALSSVLNNIMNIAQSMARAQAAEASQWKCSKPKKK